MDHEFWHQKWRSSEIGFHEGKPNGLLTEYFKVLALDPGARVFLPMCGKTLDIAWLLEAGYQVVGAELSALAIDQLFDELGKPGEMLPAGNLQHYRAADLDVFVGDIFDLRAHILGQVDAVYDRAALVALDAEMRKGYARHVMTLSGGAPQLIVSFEYDQALFSGPPFSVNEEEIIRHFSDQHQIKRLTTRPVPGGLKGQYPATEVAWLLQ